MIKLFSTPSTTPGLFGGGLLGYVIYDCTHYYLHHGQPSSDPAKYLKVLSSFSFLKLIQPVICVMLHSDYPLLYLRSTISTITSEFKPKALE